jgi:hypothetical protein
MRSGILTLGVVLLVLGGIFYFVPQPMSTASQGTPDLQHQLSLLALIIGALLTFLGIILPDSEIEVKTARTDASAGKRASYERRETLTKRDAGEYTGEEIDDADDLDEVGGR